MLAKKQIAMFLVCFCLCQSVLAKGNINQIGRYTTQYNAPTAVQEDPLLAVMSVRFPNNITTIEEAMQYLLHFSGYTLRIDKQQCGADCQMLKKTLPLVNRQFDHMRLKDALSMLAGHTVFDLVQDPLHRQVYFKLKAQAKQHFGGKNG